MNELIVIEESLVIPKSWDYDVSVKKVKAIFYKWKNITSELVMELYTAREILSVQADDRSRNTSGTFVPVDKTWSDYCKEATGTSRQTVNRWLKRFFTPQIIASSTLELTKTMKGKYNIIYADPPWRYFEDGDKNQSKHYNTMILEDICQFEVNGKPVTEIAADDAVLFLWVTGPMLGNFMDVVRYWGFEYSTIGFNWIKATKDGKGFAFGLGSWTRANSELCIIARRGSVPRQNASISQIIYSVPGKHSEKPDIVRDKIIELVGDLPRIELFGRKKTPGWDVIGNQC